MVPLLRDRSRPPTTLPDATTALFPAIGAANLVMQLAMPGVGRGVVESRVDSGNAYRRVLKRQRTTGQFLAVALLGSSADKSAYRAAIREVHTHVHSRIDDAVHYSGNDPVLQRWVAMCLFKGYLDSWELLYGPLDEDVRDNLVAQAGTLGTTLEMRPAQWPQSFTQFAKMWDDTVPTLSIDDDVRQHLQGLADLSFLHEQWGPLGRVVSATFGRDVLFLARGALPAEFRTMMRWEWSSADQRRFDRVLSLYRGVDFAIPWLSTVWLRGYLIDLHVRQRLRRPVLGPLKLSAP